MKPINNAGIDVLVREAICRHTGRDSNTFDDFGNQECVDVAETIDYDVDDFIGVIVRDVNKSLKDLMSPYRVDKRIVEGGGFRPIFAELRSYCDECDEENGE